MTSTDLQEIEARAADWIAERDRYDATLPPDRQQALDAWLAASTAHRVAFLRLEHAWRRADRLGALPASGAQRRRTPLAWIAHPAVYRTAAAFCTVLVAVLLVTQFGRSPETQRYATARGQREQVALADGSHLTLNTATHVRTAVTPRAREVWLDEGEAFFDIAHDARRPFVVHAGAQTVTVLGTKFSLLREGDRLRVAVLEGRVQVKAPRGTPTVLTRDDAALAERDNVLVTRKSTQQLKAGLSWMQGKLVFDQATLADAARQFNRYGRKQLVIEDDAAARIGIGGVFDADNVEAFARLLHVGFGLDVNVVGDEIRVSSPAS
ncbi:FecR domain-containing protein [Telluria mixta]|uniref:FecR domain-containing protein n=1 Tax=Telluria mixta TaxID=34071 RepID=A0ABT2BXS1_9BURK|nr:FecR domain-containing protein [Telluria mixta]MCS0629939.1 FecR domain-containing protein [Telluria mixta]